MEIKAPSALYSNVRSAREAAYLVMAALARAWMVARAEADPSVDSIRAMHLDASVTYRGLMDAERKLRGGGE